MRRGRILQFEREDCVVKIFNKWYKTTGVLRPTRLNL
ncbi:hypothetical protein PCC7424_1482 [Gloeothece citriformis PCC 7424]|uniref:Uncharacterized protein n=1 Tax=Gloeothece citriformis (strain PCC 7424) TaxID=65393 RepID=B7K8G3_GLOC7|nr:hypothetical protein PCC7424_1482 [Gloeothece citriformis PCC 7424]